MTVPVGKNWDNVNCNVVIQQFVKEIPVVNFIERFWEVEKAYKYMTTRVCIVQQQILYTNYTACVHIRHQTGTGKQTVQYSRKCIQAEF